LDKEKLLMKKTQEKKEGVKRILGRRLAKELSSQDMKMVVGGTTSCSPCADDCDQIEI
jgi:natural product precursor